MTRARRLLQARALGRPVAAACRVRCPCGGRLAPIPEGELHEVRRTCTRCHTEWMATPVTDLLSMARQGVRLFMTRRGKLSGDVSTELCAVLG